MTSRTDSFNRADGAIGTPSDSGSAWVQNIGTWAISTNRANESTGAVSVCVATLESSAANVEVQVTLDVYGNYPGVCGRLSDASNFFVVQTVSGAGWDLFKNVATTYTQLGARASGTPVAGDVLKLVFNGNSVELFVNGVSKISVTESFNNTATKHGIATYNDSTTRFETFSITDTGGGGGSPALMGQACL